MQRREITLEFYKGYSYRDTDARGVRRTVLVEAFGLRLYEVVTYHGLKTEKPKEYDLGYVCVRSTHLAYLLRRLTKECQTIKEMKELTKKIRPSFQREFDRDAKLELKKQLGIQSPKKQRSEKKKQYRPLDEIQLPTEWQGLGRK